MIVLYIMYVAIFMGKGGPKPSFVDVPCPNEDCDNYGKLGNENVVGNGYS